MPTKSTREKLLPELPSELIAVAMKDLAAAEKSPLYQINMGRWHEPEAVNGEVKIRIDRKRKIAIREEPVACSVCLAGSVMAGSLKADPTSTFEPSCFPANSDKLRALDCFRIGSVGEALRRMGFEDDDRYGHFFSEYSDSRSMPAYLKSKTGSKRFHVAMKKLAADESTACNLNSKDNPMRSIEEMVRQEFLLNVTSLVLTLGGIYSSSCLTGKNSTQEQRDLCQAAACLQQPVGDYEEAAIQEGWVERREGEWTNANDDLDSFCETAEEICQKHNIEPYEWEVYEYWAVSDRMAELLTAAGERVEREDFCGLNVWARTNTGQIISFDPVIRRIYAETHGEG